MYEIGSVISVIGLLLAAWLFSTREPNDLSDEEIQKNWIDYKRGKR